MTDAQPTPTPEEIGRWMVEHDRFARSLGVELEEAREGYARAALTVRGDMLNAVGLTQGGVAFTLADFAFAVASNSHGTTAVSLNAGINYPAPSYEGDRLVATAHEQNKTGRTGLYTVDVRNSEGALAALFTGTVYRRSDSVADWMKKIDAQNGGDR